MQLDQIRDWLLLVGKRFSIREAFHRWQPDEKLSTVRDYFTYEIISSEPTDRHRLTDELVQNKNLSYSITKRWRTVVRVSCHSANGHYILQALEASRLMPQIQSIFGEDIKGEGCTDITSEPWIDESTKENIFTTTFTFVEYVQFNWTEFDIVVDKVDMTGKFDDIVIRTVVPPDEIEIEEEEPIIPDGV